MKRLIAALDEPRRIHGQYAKGLDPWLSVPSTVRADVTLRGLVPGATCSFRYRTVTREGASGWSQVASRLVV